MQEFENKNEKEIYKLLGDMRVLKQKGKLDTDEKLARQTIKWRDTLEYSVLEKCVRHYSEECRLETLALLVESKKSTLQFTSKELDIILLFLKCNLCEKMEYVPLFKKALKRLKDSLTVMQRQLAQEIKIRNCYSKHDHVTSEMYEEALVLSYKKTEQIEENVRNYTMFCVDLCDICVSNMYPDATYYRRRSSLQILLLAQEFFCDKFLKWKEEQAAKIFQCLLLDTYEPNKEMAYQILKSMNPILLHLDSESQVQLTIEIAFKLGSSIQPIDSVTAAYMLKISKLSPVLKNLLCVCCNEGDNVTEEVTLQLVLLLHGKLQEALVLAKRNVGMAILKCSLYGYLFCIRSLLLDCDLRSVGMHKSWQKAVESIISICIELKHTVSVVVNNSSPEGHLPVDLKTLNFEDNISLEEMITPQMALLCSWRTVKEISQLFGFFATKASIRTSESMSGLLTEIQIVQIMEHLVSFLCETKHRGAFEQAYVGFHQLCTRLWRLTDSVLSELPIHCLHDILVGITGLMPGYSKLCATRRSAGVPFMIQAVLSSEPKLRDNSMSCITHWVMKILLQFAELDSTVNLWQKVKCIMYENTIFYKYEQTTEPVIENRDNYEKIKLDVTEIRTHSMNILRALFRHSQLRDIVKDYIADGLIVAFKNYDSKTWAERNAATLLFSALIIRIFGVQRTKDHINLTTDNKMTGRIFFERYPSLLPFILDELQTFVSINDTTIKLNVQAILLLLSRLYINYHSDGMDITWKVNKFINLVSQCAKSPVLKTRELAARALVPLLTENTACHIVETLFRLIFNAVRDTRVSANLTHGYLLQILEILVRLPSVSMRIIKSKNLMDLLNAADWILKDSENKTNSSNRFPIATVYVDILHELYKTDKNMIDNSNMEYILRMLKQYLMEKDVLKLGPGEHMYKVSVIKFILCVGKHSDLLQTTHDGQSEMYEIYSQLLIIPEAEIQSIAWNTVSEVLQEVKESRQRKLLKNYAIYVAVDFTENLYRCNPKLQDAVFDFLYNSLMGSCVVDASSDKRKICTLVLEKMHSHDASNIYSQRVNYLRLLGKCMTTLIHELKDKELEARYKEDVYKKVCDNKWIGSLCEDFRSSVFDILYDLYNKDVSAEQCHPILDWWTVLLQLLVDDDASVRHEASKLICKIEPRNDLECIERNLPVFFQKFNDAVANKCPGIAISALFCWSVSLLGDTDYEMDETDVFNKCRNYVIYEPIKILELCFNLTNSIVQRYTVDNALPADAVKWMNYRLETTFDTFSFRDIICAYMSNVPLVTEKFIDVLDPTYKDKLLRFSVGKKYMSLL